MFVFRLCLVVLFASVVGFGAAVESADQKPAEHYVYFAPSGGANKVELKVSGKLREYYLLDATAPIEVSIKGPAKLKLLSRVILASASDTVDYSYSIERSGASKPLTVKHSSFRSEKSLFAGPMDGAVGESRSRVIDVPSGEQVYRISLPAAASHKLLFRFGRDGEDYNGATVIAMTPAEFTTAVDLVTKEETLTYYRVGIGNRVVMNLIGPVTLKVLTRIEFDPTMSEAQKWKVGVTEDGVLKSTYSLSARKSDATSYKQLSSFVPSAAEVFYVDVPAGSHRYEFSLPNDQRSCLMRCLLPRRQIDRE